MAHVPRSTLAGARVMFTGKLRQLTREEAEVSLSVRSLVETDAITLPFLQTAARALGAVPARVVTKRVALVIAGKRSSGAKLRDAERLGVPVISEDQWAARCAEAQAGALPCPTRAPHSS